MSALTKMADSSTIFLSGIAAYIVVVNDVRLTASEEPNPWTAELCEIFAIGSLFLKGMIRTTGKIEAAIV